MLRLAQLNPHIRDARIKFFAEGHRYVIQLANPSKAEYQVRTSCTTFIHHFAQPFDADEIIGKMTRGKKWPRRGYLLPTLENQSENNAQNRETANQVWDAEFTTFQQKQPGKKPDWAVHQDFTIYFKSRMTDLSVKPLTPQQIKYMWNENGRQASEAGTIMHDTIELFLNSAEDRTALHTFLRENRQQLIDGSPAINAYLCSLDVPMNTRELRMFMAFYIDQVIGDDSDNPLLVPYRTEWLVYDMDYDIAGALDCVMYDPRKNTFVYLDWKRSKEIKMDNPWQSCKEPISHLPDCNFSHYSLQASHYKYILGKYYGVEITAMANVVFHPNQQSYQYVDLPDRVAEIKMMLEHHKTHNPSDVSETDLV